MQTNRRWFLGGLACGAASLTAVGCRQDSGVGTATPAEPTPPGPDPASPRFPDKTLLVLGGTGFLGPHVVEAALAAGWTVTLFNRGKTNPHLFPELEKLVGDRDGKLEALEGRRFAAVIDTSGYVPRVVRMSAELLAPNVGQYMFVSSVSAYADFSGQGIDEDYPVAQLEDPNTEDVPTFYGALKAACEAAVRQVLPDNTTVVRPGLIVGPGDPTDRFTYWPARIDQGGEVLAPGTADDPVQVIDVRDLAAWMVGAISTPHLGTYNLVGPFPAATIGDLLASCQRHAAQPSSLVWADKDFLEAQEVAPWVHMPVWVPPGAEGFEGFATVSGQRALDTGLATRGLDQTVRDTLAWWREQDETRRAQLRAGIPREREQSLLAAWHAAQGHARGIRRGPTTSSVGHAA